MDPAVIGAYLVGIGGILAAFLNRQSSKDDFSLRGLKQLSDACMERCGRLEERVGELEDELRLRNAEIRHLRAIGEP